MEEKKEKINYPYLRVALLFDEIKQNVEAFACDLDVDGLVDWENPEFKILIDHSAEAFAAFQRLDEKFRI